MGRLVLDNTIGVLEIHPQDLIPSVYPSELTIKDIEECWDVSFEPLVFAGRHLDLIRADARRWHRLKTTFISCFVLRVNVALVDVVAELDVGHHFTVGMIELAAIAQALHQHRDIEKKMYQQELVLLGLDVAVPTQPNSSKYLRPALEWRRGNRPMFRHLAYTKDEPQNCFVTHRFVGCTATPP